MFSLPTCHNTQEMCSPITLSYNKYLFFNFSFGTPSQSFRVHASCLHSLSLYFKFNSLLLSPALPRTMQREERFPHTHRDLHADLIVSGQDSFWKLHYLQQKSLCAPEVNTCLLNYSDAAALSKFDLMNFPLTFSALLWRLSTAPGLYTNCYASIPARTLDPICSPSRSLTWNVIAIYVIKLWKSTSTYDQYPSYFKI